jgi:hypothetical protein
MFDVGVEAVCLFPPNGSNLGGMSLRENLTYDSSIERVAAVRLYLNYELQRVLVIPYVSFVPYKVDETFTTVLPNALKSLRKIKLEEKADEDLTVHRIIKFSASYWLGKNFLSAVGLAECSKLVPFTGLEKNEKFMRWLDVPVELESLWMYLEKNKRDSIPDATEDRQKQFTKTLKGILKDKAHYSQPYGNLFYLSHSFYQLSESIPMTEIEDRFKGICFEKLYREMGTVLSKEIMFNKYNALLFKLCDWGAGVTKLVIRDGVVGTAVFTGELDCCAPSMLASGLTCALSTLDGYDESIIGAFAYYAEKAAKKRGIENYVREFFTLQKLRSDTPPARVDEIQGGDEFSCILIGLGRWCRSLESKSIKNHIALRSFVKKVFRRVR